MIIQLNNNNFPATKWFLWKIPNRCLQPAREIGQHIVMGVGANMSSSSDNQLARQDDVIWKPRVS